MLVDLLLLLTRQHDNRGRKGEGPKSEQRGRQGEGGERREGKARTGGRGKGEKRRTEQKGKDKAGGEGKRRGRPEEKPWLRPQP